MFNLSDEDGTVGCEFYDIGVDVAHGFDLVEVIDGEKIGIVSENMSVNIPAYDCRIYRGKFITL